MRAPARFIVREAILVTAVGLLWLVEARLPSESTWATQAFRVFVGLATVVPGALLHEWGHLIASLSTRAQVHYPEGWVDKLLFDFDVETNDRRQFLIMSAGGYLGSAVGVTLFVWLLPLDRLSGQVALAGAALGMLVSVIIEMPTTIRVLRGQKPPPALIRVSRTRP